MIGSVRCKTTIESVKGLYIIYIVTIFHSILPLSILSCHSYLLKKAQATGAPEEVFTHQFEGLRSYRYHASDPDNAGVEKLVPSLYFIILSFLSL